MAPITCTNCDGIGGYGVSDERGEPCGAEQCDALGCVAGILHCDVCGALATTMDDGVPLCGACQAEGARIDALTVAEYAAELGVSS